MHIKLVFCMLVVAFGCAAPFAATAASPEESYLAARDAYIKRFNAKDWGAADVQKITQQELGALRDLERQLNKIIGDPGLKGFPAEGRLNVESLQRGDLGFGTLDGIAYTRDDKTRVVVTNETLLKAWLRAHRNWIPKHRNPPQDVAQALQSDVFYTQAISTDAAVAHFAAVPVSKPAQGFATALLVMRRQDVGPGTPGELLVAVVNSPRVVLVSAPAAVKIEPATECQAIWSAAEKKAAEAFEKYQASNRKDARQLASQNKIEEDGDAAFRKCYGERAPRDPAFGRLTAQANELVNLVTGK